MKESRHPREQLIEAVWGPKGALEALPAKVTEHLDYCPECRQFLAELKATRKAALSAGQETNVTAEETAFAVRRAMQAAEALGALSPDTGNVQTRPTLKEKIGFGVLALSILGVQGLLILALKPTGFLVLEGLLNWLAPFIFYIIFHISRRSTKKEEGAA